MHPRRLGLQLSASLLLLPLAGCGEDATGTQAGAKAGTVPITPGALAAVVADHVDGDPLGGTSSSDDFGYTEKPVGADVVLGEGGEETGRISVMVGDQYDEGMVECTGDWADVLDGCEDYEGGTVMWQEEEPEEDPGILYFAARRGDAMVLVELGGPTINGDPREQDDLPVSTQTLADIAGDERVGLLTTEEAVQAGEDLGWFGKGSDG